MPIALMNNSIKLIFRYETMQRLCFKRSVITFNIVKNFRIHNHIPYVNQIPVKVRFFSKCIDRAIIIKVDDTLRLPKVIYRQCAYLARFFMFVYKFGKVNIADSISIGKHKGFIANILLYSFYSATGLCIVTSIDNCYLPIILRLVVNNSFIAAHIKSYIVIVKEIMRKIFLDNSLLISCAYNKFIETLRRINFHNMDKNRIIPYFNHGLRF